MRFNDVILLSDHVFVFNVCVCVFQRDEEIARRQAAKEKKEKEREERLKEQPAAGQEEEEEEEEEEELPSIYIPDPPSPLYCGFYSQPGQFWLSMVHTHTPNHNPISTCSLI